MEINIFQVRGGVVVRGIDHLTEQTFLFNGSNEEANTI